MERGRERKLKVFPPRRKIRNNVFRIPVWTARFVRKGNQRRPRYSPFVAAFPAQRPQLYCSRRANQFDSEVSFCYLPTGGRFGNGYLAGCENRDAPFQPASD